VLRRPLLALPILAAALVATGCGVGKTKTETVINTQTVVRTVTTPPTGTATTPTTTSTPTPVPSGPRSCGRIDLNYPNGEGGSSAVGIVATGLGCTEARAVTRACQRGNLTPGWSARRRNSGILLTAGSRRITFLLAGGGGCLP
jgi:hypothetical protein